MAINARSLSTAAFQAAVTPASGRPEAGGTAGRMPAVLIVFLFVGCGGDNPTNLVRDVATEVKEKPRVQLIVRIAGEQPTPEELQLRRSLEDRIDNERIGRLVSSGAGSGQMDIVVEVDNTADGITQLRKIVLDAGVLKQSSFKVLPSEPDK